MSKFYLTLLVLCGSLLSASSRNTAPVPPWDIYTFGKQYDYKPMVAPPKPGIAHFYFPVIDGNNYRFAAVLSTVRDTKFIGDLTGKTLTISFHIVENGNPVYWYGGLLPGWNGCPEPAFFRVFLSPLYTPYSVHEGVVHKNNYWWSDPICVPVDGASGTIKIRVSDLFAWSNANMGKASNHAVEFRDVITRVRQIGLFFSGGCYWDLGVGLAPNTGISMFVLDSFDLTDYQ